MKTEFEKRSRYGIDSWMFGPAKIKYRLFYFVVISVILVLAFLFG